MVIADTDSSEGISLPQIPLMPQGAIHSHHSRQGEQESFYCHPVRQADLINNLGTILYQNDFSVSIF
jgi:hypothetical protein